MWEITIRSADKVFPDFNLSSPLVFPLSTIAFSFKRMSTPWSLSAATVFSRKVSGKASDIGNLDACTIVMCFSGWAVLISPESSNKSE